MTRPVPLEPGEGVVIARARLSAIYVGLRNRVHSHPNAAGRRSERSVVGTRFPLLQPGVPAYASTVTEVP
ncbi:hypothetical protein GCM10028793_02810 [Nocardiopsis oceani]